MEEKVLKKLKRAELLEMLLEQSKEVERLKKELQKASTELEKANTELQNRDIQIANAGSIAEAALQVNGVFEAAQKAAKQYLENIEKLSGKQDAILAEREVGFKRKMKHMLAETQAKCEELEKKCEARLVETDRQIEEKWNNLEERWEKLCTARDDMQEMVRNMQRGRLADGKESE